jgi:hypothetical protein
VWEEGRCGCQNDGLGEVCTIGKDEKQGEEGGREEGREGGREGGRKHLYFRR